MAKSTKDFLNLESLRGDDGRISVEDFDQHIDAVSDVEYEARRPALEALTTRKKRAADELIGLGISEDSAYLISGYVEIQNVRPKKK